MGSSNINRLLSGALVVLTLALIVSAQANDSAVARSDILLHIVTQCVEPTTANYCEQCNFPRADRHCGVGAECKKTTEVLARNAQYVVIRDSKMCGCPAEFFHGLALPLDVVTGVEDSKRPEGIWQFAWEVAAERIEPESIALVVNPKSQRSQNQLHIHLVRLDGQARPQFDRNTPSYVNHLDHVWAIAERDAKSKGLTDYGVLVAQQSPGQFVVVTTPSSPEAMFTQWSCH